MKAWLVALALALTAVPAAAQGFDHSHAAWSALLHCDWRQLI